MAVIIPTCFLQEPKNRNAIMTIGESLKKLMRLHNINTMELFRRTGVGQPVIYRIMTDNTDNPKMATLCALSNYFGITINKLIGSDNGDLADEQNNKIFMVDWENVDNHGTDGKDSGYILDNSLNVANIYALKIEDNSMDLLFPIGTVLLIDKIKTPKNKSFVIVKNKNEPKAIFRQLLFGDNKHRYLMPLSQHLDGFKIRLFSKHDKYCGVLVQSRKNF